MVYFQHPESPHTPPSHLPLERQRGRECGLAGGTRGQRGSVCGVGGSFNQAWLQQCGAAGIWGTVPCRGKAGFLLDVLLHKTGLRVTISGRSLTATSNLQTPIPEAQSTQKLSSIPSPPKAQSLLSCLTKVSLLPTPPYLSAFAHTLPSAPVSSSLPGEPPRNLQSPAPMLFFL